MDQSILQRIPRTLWVWFVPSNLLMLGVTVFFFLLIFFADLLAGVPLRHLNDVPIILLELYFPLILLWMYLYEVLATIRRVHTFQFEFRDNHFYVHEENPNVKRERKIWYWQITSINFEKITFFGPELFTICIYDQMPYEYSDGSQDLNWPGRGILGIEKRVTRIPGLTQEEAGGLKRELEIRISKAEKPMRKPNHS
jgi:hypothetical protein